MLLQGEKIKPVNTAGSAYSRQTFSETLVLLHLLFNFVPIYPCLCSIARVKNNYPNTHKYYLYLWVITMRSYFAPSTNAHS